MKKLFPKNITFSLRFWLFLIFFLGVISRAVFMYFFYPQRFMEQAINASRSEIISITNLSAFSASQAMQTGNTEALEQVLSAIRQNSEIRFIVITDTKQNLIAGHNVESAILSRYTSADSAGILSEDGVTMIAKSEMFSGSEKIGSIYIGLSLDAMLEEVRATKEDLTFYSIFILFIGTPIVYFLTYLLIKPFKNMALTSQHIAKGDFTKRVEKAGYTEVKNLAEAFNQMVDQLTTVQEQVRSANRTLEIRINERTKDLQQEIVQRKKTESALRESEERFRALVELSPDAIVILTDDQFIFMNTAAATMFRVQSMDRMKGKTLYQFMNPVQKRQFEETLHQILHGSVVNILSEFLFMREDGTEFVAEVSATKLLFGGKVSIQIAIRDISERIKNERQRVDLEQQLLHVQKKEIVSTLASGLAHDILNILGIIGTAINKLLFLKDIDNASLMASAEQISKASERGRSLVRQLLSFARKSELNFSSVQMNAIVSEISGMLQRIFPTTIALEVSLTPDLPQIRADNNQIHQALLNLCLNSRDAILESGTIRISTEIKEGRASDSSREYICISVCDDGSGMSEEVLQKIYEPFFTTKAEGTGSGLGLAMVKGIVENHRGYIEVESAHGKGTTFRLFFPV